MQGSAKRLIKAALQEAARKREMRYSDLYKIDKKVRRHFHDDITVIVLFLNHDLISRGAVLNSPLTVRSALDHWHYYDCKHVRFSYTGVLPTLPMPQKYSFGTLLEYTIHTAPTYAHSYPENLFMLQLVTLFRNLSIKTKRKKKGGKKSESNFWLPIRQIPCLDLRNAVIACACLI